MVVRVVFVTGAARGLGRAIADSFACEDETHGVVYADVNVTTLEDPNELAKTVEGPLPRPDKALCVACDVRKREEVDAAFKAAKERFGFYPNIVVCNAGVLKPSKFLDITPEEWEFVNSVNTDGVFHTMQLGCKYMLEEANRIRSEGESSQQLALTTEAVTNALVQATLDDGLPSPPPQVAAQPTEEPEGLDVSRLEELLDEGIHGDSTKILSRSMSEKTGQRGGVDGLFKPVSPWGHGGGGGRGVDATPGQFYGRIITISSQGGRSVSKLGGAHYTTSKAAVIGLTRAAAFEMGEHGVRPLSSFSPWPCFVYAECGCLCRFLAHISFLYLPFACSRFMSSNSYSNPRMPQITCNAVCPGVCNTEMAMRQFANPGVARASSGKVLEAIPVRRLGEMSDIANVCKFLGTPLSGYMNGACLDVNGGNLML